MTRKGEPGSSSGGGRAPDDRAGADAGSSGTGRSPGDWRVSKNASVDGDGGSKGDAWKALGLFLIMGLLVVWNVQALRVEPEPASPERQERLASLKLYHAATAVERARSETGRLPSSLASLNIPPGAFEYVRADTGYTLMLATTDTEVSYRSGTPLEELLGRAGVAKQ